MALFTEVSPNQRYKKICHNCGSKTDGLYSLYHRVLRDLNFVNNPGFIIFNYRKVYSPSFGKIRVA